MGRKRKLINKQAKKRADGKCYFCPEPRYAVLNCHRVVPGEDEGKYTEFNTITVCANCHNLIHTGHIVIDRKYFSTAGRYVLHFWEDGLEKWL